MEICYDEETRERIQKENSMDNKSQDVNNYGYDLRSRGTRVKNSFLHLAGETLGLGLEAGKFAFDKGNGFYSDMKKMRAEQRKNTTEGTVATQSEDAN